MKKTRMLVLCVCLTFILGRTEGQTNATVTNNNTGPTGITQFTGTTPLPDNSSTHVTSNNHTTNGVTTSPPPASNSAISSVSTATATSSQQPTVSTGAPQNSTSSTNQNSTSGTPGSNAPSTAATTLKGGSAALFGCYSQLLMPVISFLIYSA